MAINASLNSYENTLTLVLDPTLHILFAVHTDAHHAYLSILPSLPQPSPSYPHTTAANNRNNTTTLIWYQNSTKINFVSSVLLSPGILLVAVTTTEGKTYALVYLYNGDKLDELVLNTWCKFRSDEYGVIYTSLLSPLDDTFYVLTWNDSLQKLTVANSISIDFFVKRAVLRNNSLYLLTARQMCQFPFNTSSPPASLYATNATKCVAYEHAKPGTINSVSDLLVSSDGARLVSIEQSLNSFDYSPTVVVFNRQPLELLGFNTIEDPEFSYRTASLSHHGNAILLGTVLFDIYNPEYAVELPTGWVPASSSVPLTFLASTMSTSLDVVYLAYNDTGAIEIFCFDTSPVVNPVQIGVTGSEKNVIPRVVSLVSDPVRGYVYSSAGPRLEHGDTPYMRKIDLTKSVVTPPILYWRNWIMKLTAYSILSLGNYSQYMVQLRITSTEWYTEYLLCATNATFELELDSTAQYSSPKPFHSFTIAWGPTLYNSIIILLSVKSPTIITMTVTPWNYIRNADRPPAFNQSSVSFPGFVRATTSPFSHPLNGNIPNTIIGLAFSTGAQVLRVILGSADGSDVVLQEFELSADHQLKTTNNFTIMEGCRYLQSQMEAEEADAEGKGMWVSCASNSLQSLLFFRVDLDTRVLQCEIFIAPVEVTSDKNQTFPPLLWQLSTDATRLVIVYEDSFLSYDISSCATGGSYRVMGEFGITRMYDAVTIYTTNTKEHLIVVEEAITGSITIIAECPLGMTPNGDQYCSQCPVGFYGPNCVPCLAGFVCDQPGTTYATQLCPAGYYCPEGTKTNEPSQNATFAPLSCPAGSYCPRGVAVGNVSSDLNSPKLCAIGYYCPENSSVPSAVHCPNDTSSGVGARDLDDCKCNTGLYGYAGQCMRCPSDLCTCSGNVISQCYLPSGWNMSHLLQNNVDPLPCSQYSIDGGNPCNPDMLPWFPGDPFPCEEGYTGRLCSKCLRDYYANGKRCEKCAPHFPWQLSLTYVVVCIILALYVWHTSPRKSAIIQIAAFHFQSLYTLLMGNIKWQFITFSFLQSASNSSNFSLVAIECLFNWWSAQWTLVATMMLPLIAALFAGCACVVFWLFKRLITCTPPRDLSLAYFTSKYAKMTILLISLGYFAILLSVLQMLGCTGVDHASGHHYLTAYPWMECNKQWFGWMGVAVVGLVVEVAGLPVLLARKLYHIHHTEQMHNPWNLQVFGTFYSAYSTKHFYWELVVTTRRFFTALLISIFPSNSPIVLVGFFLLVLCYMTLQMKCNPYISAADNMLDTLSQVVLMSSVFAGVVMGLPIFKLFTSALSWFVTVFNALFLVLTILLLLDLHGPRVVQAVQTVKARVIRCLGRRRNHQPSADDATTTMRMMDEDIPLISNKQQ